jgi:hypothetical protein
LPTNLTTQNKLRIFNENLPMNGGNPSYFEQVEFLLTELNLSSNEINSLEKSLTDAISRKSYLLDSLSTSSGQSDIIPQLNSYMRSLLKHKDGETYQLMLIQMSERKSEIGDATRKYVNDTNMYDKARAEFDAHFQAIKSASTAGRGTLDSLPLSSDEQCRLGQLSVEVLVAQKNRDASEKIFVNLIRDFNEFLLRLDAFRKQIGSDKETQALKDEAKIENIRNQIIEEDSLIDRIRSDIQSMKARYQGAMLRLEEVSNGVRQLESETSSEESNH